MNFKCKPVKGGVLAASLVCSLLYTFEGKVNETYLDPVGIVTACGGHTSKDLKLGMKFTDEECDILMAKDAYIAIEAINKYVKVQISEHTATALTSFIYNMGVGEFKDSMILTKLNSGDIVGACNEIARCEFNAKKKKYTGYGCGWSQGKRLKGLIARREKERKLCLQF